MLVSKQYCFFRKLFSLNYEMLFSSILNFWIGEQTCLRQILKADLTHTFTFDKNALIFLSCLTMDPCMFLWFFIHAFAFQFLLWFQAFTNIRQASLIILWDQIFHPDSSIFHTLINTFDCLFIILSSLFPNLMLTILGFV